MFTPLNLSDLIQVNDYLWEIPKTFRTDMHVKAQVFATKALLNDILEDRSLSQLVNVTTLPGILEPALVMPDVHEGYGFPVGGVAAFDLDEGIISPGGIGYDINCGVRLLRSSLMFSDIKDKLPELGDNLFKEIPSGVGRGGHYSLNEAGFREVLTQGAKKIIDMGLGKASELDFIESQGCLPDAQPDKVSLSATRRGHDQLGTIGAGNHFVEVDRVEHLYDETAAKNLHLSIDQVVVQIHTGSRGFGHQIATDYVRLMLHQLDRYHLSLPDRELACAPFKSVDGQDYLAAMSCAANFAWANRQLIAHEVRQAFIKTFGDLDTDLTSLYDVAHNIAKVEEYEIDGKKRFVILHRKGATRAFPGQPVLIPGSMGTASYVLLGKKEALTKSFGSSCHGAGRRMSRTEALHKFPVEKLEQNLAQEGIVVRAGSRRDLPEEAPEAYKDIDAVVDVIHTSGIAEKVARLRPVAVIKG